MPSVVKIAALAALVALTLFTTSTQAQDIMDAYSKSGSEGGFQDALNSLSTLSEGPYPSAFSLMAPAAPGPLQVLGVVNKRASYCQPGYGKCSDGCCPLNELCYPEARGCCPQSLPYGCGNKYCCPYKYCLKNGHCACDGDLYRCGNKCCKYGCSSNGGCGCPSNYPVDCGDGCCQSGYTCAPGGKCQRYIGGGGGDPITRTTRTTTTTTTTRPPPTPTTPELPSISPPDVSPPPTNSIEVVPTIQPQSGAESLRCSSRVTILAVIMPIIALVLV